MAEVHVDPLTVERFRLRSWPQLCERFRREEPGRYLPADDVATPSCAASSKTTMVATRHADLVRAARRARHLPAIELAPAGVSLGRS